MFENLNDFTDILPQTTPMGNWNCIRQGVTEEENPNHVAMLLAGNGSKLAEFKTASLAPTAEEVLKQVVAICAKLGGKRPCILGIDEPNCLMRMQFLTQGTKNLRVLGLNVKRQQGPPPSQQQKAAKE